MTSLFEPTSINKDHISAKQISKGKELLQKMDGFPLKLEPTTRNGRLIQLVVDIAKPEETEELHHFLVNYFMTSSPLDRLFQVNEPGADEEILKLRRERPWYADVIRNNSVNLCLTVRDESDGGSLVALAINLIEEKEASENKKPEPKNDRRTECSKLSNGNCINTCNILLRIIICSSIQHCWEL